MFYIRHHVRSEKDLKILLTCLICYGDLFGKTIRALSDAKNLIEANALIVKEKIQHRKEYECICPHCHSFSITYINDMKRELREMKSDSLTIEGS